MDPVDSLERAEARPLLHENYSAGHYEDNISLKVPRGPPSQRKPSHWKAPAIILGFEYLLNTAFFGIATNLVVYLSNVLHGTNTSNAANAATWFGTSFFTPLVGAIISDALWGNYKIVIVSSLIYLLGLVIITISSLAPFLKPPPCEGSSCQPASEAQNLVFFSGLYLVAFGCGGVRSSLLPLGAEQFDKENPTERENKGTFFNLFYLFATLGILTSSTLIVWVQENVDWSVGFGIATSCMALGFGGFILGTSTYRLRMPSGSPLKSILQVLIACFTKMSLEVPMDRSLLYEATGKNSNVLVQQRLAHTDEFRFLDKAAIIFNSDLKDCDPQISWRLCTITQVEELKILVRFLPIWVAGVLYSVAYSQMSTTFVEQGIAMDTRIGRFSIPPASLSSFKVISAMAWLLVYNKIFVPASRMYQQNGAGISLLQQMGIGHFMMIMTMAIAAFVEMKRLESIRAGKPISIAYQLPQYFTLGGSEVLYYVGQSMFFYDQAPDTMKTMCTSFSLLTASLGHYFNSLAVTIVRVLTTVGGGPGWIPADLNKGQLDYFFWSLAGLCTLNFAAYLGFSRNYTPKKVIWGS